MKTPAHHLLSRILSLRWFVFAGVAAILFLGCYKPSGHNDSTSISKEPRAPSSYSQAEYAQLGWVGTNNARARVNDYRGKVLVLDFYATWCEPCRQSIPRLNELQKAFGSTGLEIVGLNVGGPDDRVKVNEFARQLNIQYPLGFPDKSLTDLFLADDQTIPQTFIFGRSGELKKRFIGYQANTSADLETVVKMELERSNN